MSTWGDDNSDGDNYQAPAERRPSVERNQAPLVRPRLQLKPRSVTAGSTNTSSSSSKPSLFGAARTREEVLASKGIDPKLVEARIERKSVPLRLSKEQDEEMRALRAELAYAESQLREANENEMPEEAHRVAVAGKKKDLEELTEKFRVVNLEKAEKDKERKGSRVYGEAEATSSPNARPGRGSQGERRKFERPSERRRRLVSLLQYLYFSSHFS
mmetsp:Transcript_6725/g.14496  ORF Transcript_6725/g.14496 Transcript_6725/m.14496 type:complete len:215 (-) Transcript_6725:412-1056(-)